MSHPRRRKCRFDSGMPATNHNYVVSIIPIIGHKKYTNEFTTFRGLDRP